jgi:hypothetical protein
MGHYYAEMFPRGKDNTFYQRWADYQRERAIEIEKIISKNPIEFEEIEIGEKLFIYAPLKGISKISFDNDKDFPLIRSLFSSSEHYYGWSLWPLATGDNFTVYDKRVDVYRETEKHPLLRISSPPEPHGKYPAFDFSTFQHWVSPKFFQKK